MVLGLKFYGLCDIEGSKTLCSQVKIREWRNGGGREPDPRAHQLPSQRSQLLVPHGRTKPNTSPSSLRDLREVGARRRNPKFHLNLSFDHDHGFPLSYDGETIAEATENDR